MYVYIMKFCKQTAEEEENVEDDEVFQEYLSTQHQIQLPSSSNFFMTRIFQPVIKLCFLNYVDTLGNWNLIPKRNKERLICTLVNHKISKYL